MTRPKKLRPSSRLVHHDIRVHLTHLPDGGEHVSADVECERCDCAKDIDACRACERFVRIEAHEGGYTMLCRSRDEAFDAHSAHDVHDSSEVDD